MEPNEDLHLNEINAIQSRLALLEDGMKGHLGMTFGEMIAMRLLLRALIMHHPEPESVKSMFQSLASDRINDLPDAGFEEGVALDATRLYGKHLQQSVHGWIDAWPDTDTDWHE